MAWHELICRTHFSLLEGTSFPDEVVTRARELGLSSLGITDRDCVYGVVAAHREARELGLVTHPGALLTVVGAPPVAALVEDVRGWAHLCRLLTEGRKQVEKGRCELTVAQLAERADGLSWVLMGPWQPEVAAPLVEAAPGRVSVAWARQGGPIDRALDQQARALAGALSLPLLATADVRYHLPQKRPLADVLTCIRRRTTLDRAGRVLERNQARHLTDEATMLRRFADAPEAVRHSCEVAERLAFQVDQLSYVYPHEVVPPGWTAMTWLRQLTHQGLSWRYPQGTPPQIARQVQHELAIIERLEFPSYFLTVYDIVRFARSRGILCQGRGSAANSAVCYALGITPVDPATSALLFERFISEERGEPPDIDVDFEHERREEVLQYVYARYGRHRAGMVNEVVSYRGRSAIRDVGKVFGLSLDQVDRLAKATSSWSLESPEELEVRVSEAGLDIRDARVRQTVQLAAELQGCPRHLSIHVGGFVISETRLDDLVPIEPATMADRTVIQWNKDDVDAVKFVKVDVLALGMLTAIRRAFGFLERHWDRPLDLASVPREDPAVYAMFQQADTVGVFQIESRAQQSMLPRLKPRCFYDLVIEVAIVRPGPIQGGMVHPYLRRRSGEELVSYAHPKLEPILGRTLGVPLFQEQVMAIAVAVGGFTPGEADQLRRAMGAWRKGGRLEEMGDKLISGMVANGIERAYAEAVYQQILGFGEYGFPESHAASFAHLVYISGWLKCHYPAAFCAALINSWPMGFYAPRALIKDAQWHGVEVREVSLVHSDWDCTLEPDGQGEMALRLGLRLVQGLGQEHAGAITRAREERAFRDVVDVARRTGLDRGRLTALADAGAFSDLGVDRRQAVWQLQGLWTDLPLFAGMARREPTPELPTMSPVDTLLADYRTTGLSVHLHPIELVREALDAAGVVPLCRLPTLRPGSLVKIAGLVQSRQRPGTASGVVFMTLEDETAMANLVIWPKTFEQYRLIARNERLIVVRGVLQRQDEAVSVLAQHFERLPDAPQVASRSRDFR